MIADLRSAGYSANSHPTKPGYVVVNDPTYRGDEEPSPERTGGHWHTTVHVDQVIKFINDRS